MAHHAHGDGVEALLLEVETDTKRINSVLLECVAPSGSAMFPLDFLAFAAAKRHASTTSAFVTMVKSCNMVIARALLRMHIDTSLRFSAAWHVSEPHDFATRVLKGERIDKLKTKTGARMTDSHLVQLHKNEHPWLTDVYCSLSGYVHFSGAHITDSITELSADDGSIKFLISDQDLKFPEFSWMEVLECFREATLILERFLRGWGATKQLSDKQLEELRSDASRGN